MYDNSILMLDLWMLFINDMDWEGELNSIRWYWLTTSLFLFSFWFFSLSLFQSGMYQVQGAVRVCTVHTTLTCSARSQTQGKNHGRQKPHTLHEPGK